MKKERIVETRKGRIVMFLWQHLLLIVSLFIMTFGVALCVRSNLGSSVISTIPVVMMFAGEKGYVMSWTIGEYTYCMNALFVVLQILILRKRFEPVQLFQLAIGFVFGFLLDVNMCITSAIECQDIMPQILVQAVGCMVLALGISFEIKCGSVTMPGEGLPVAISRATGIAFPTAKIIVDISLVVIAVLLGFLFFGSWQWNAVGVGTLFAMIMVGAIVKWLNPHIEWFNRLLYYKPGFRRYIYGLARFIYGRHHE